jgi:hypothetical protein
MISMIINYDYKSTLDINLFQNYRGFVKEKIKI